MTSIISASYFSSTLTITKTKLNWKNHLSWFASVELWFHVLLHQFFHMIQH